MEYENQIKNAKNVAELFQLVKSIVKEYTGLDQAGLLVGLSDLGVYQKGFVGAYYSLSANMIIINKRPLSSVINSQPEYSQYYLFHLLLHEYIHAIGYHDENKTRQVVFELTKELFGSDHILTKMAFDLEPFAKNIIYATASFQPPHDSNIEFIQGIDINSTRYIY